MTRKLREVEQEILRCSRCGKCRSVCPVFTESLIESQVARGKIALAEAALEERLDVSIVLSDRMTLCLNCKSCVANCPAEVHIAENVRFLRHYINKNAFKL